MPANPRRHVSTRACLTLLVLLAAATPLQAQSRFEDVRWLSGRHGDSFVKDARVRDVRGVLAVDVQARQVRFEAGGQVRFAVPFDRVSSLHYQQSDYPERAFAFRRGHYLTIHYQPAAGELSFEVLRLPRDSVPRLLQVIEREAGLKVDRTPSTGSFLGLPLHLTPGHPVYVTDHAGRRIKGAVVGLSSSSIDLGPAGRFDAASIQRVVVIDPIHNGIGNGAVGVGLPLSFALWVRWCDDSDCDVFVPSFAVGLTVGALLGAIIDRNMTRAAYRAREPGTKVRLEWRPVFNGQGKAIHLSLQF